MFCDSACIMAQASVELRLSATGLITGKAHVNAEAAENINDGLGCVRKERIGQAGDEKLNLGHESIL